MRHATKPRRREPGWADDKIPDGFVSKQSAARLLNVSTVTVDRWSREQTADWPHPQLLVRYTHPGYPYTLFAREDIDRIMEG